MGITVYRLCFRSEFRHSFWTPHQRVRTSMLFVPKNLSILLRNREEQNKQFVIFLFTRGFTRWWCWQAAEATVEFDKAAPNLNKIFCISNIVNDLRRAFTGRGWHIYFAGNLPDIFNRWFLCEENLFFFSMSHDVKTLHSISWFPEIHIPVHDPPCVMLNRNSKIWWFKCCK